MHLNAKHTSFLKCLQKFSHFIMKRLEPQRRKFSQVRRPLTPLARAAQPRVCKQFGCLKFPCIHTPTFLPQHMTHHHIPIRIQYLHFISSHIMRYFFYNTSTLKFIFSPTVALLSAIAGRKYRSNVMRCLSNPNGGRKIRCIKARLHDSNFCIHFLTTCTYRP